MASLHLFLLEVLLVTSLGISYAQQLFPGRCPNLQPMQQFDPYFYLGLWYEYEKYPTTFQILGKCTTATYTPLSEGKIGVENSDIIVFTGLRRTINGEATPVNPANYEGRYTVSFFPMFFDFSDDDGNYIILDTDYGNYSIVWNCDQNPFLSNTQSLWVLTRDRYPSEATVETAEYIISELGLDTDRLVKTNQENCPVA